MNDPKRSRGSANRRISAFLITLMLFGPVLAGCSASDEESAEVKITTQAVKRGNLVVGSYADGRVSMRSQALDFDVAGTLLEIPVAEGQFVSAGDLLAVLDDKELTAALESAQREVDKAKAAYEEAVDSRDYSLVSEKLKLDSWQDKAEAKFNSLGLKDAREAAGEYLKEKAAELEDAKAAYEEAVAEDAASQVLAEAEKQVDAAKAAFHSAETGLASAERSYDAAYAKYKADKIAAEENYELQKLKVENLEATSLPVVNAQLALETAQTRLEAAQADLAGAKLYAPWDGQIVQINGTAGDDVTGKPAAEAAGSASSSLMTILDRSVITITADINEGDIGDLAPGQVARANIESLGLVDLPGKITTLGGVPKIDNSGIVSYPVKAVLDEPDDRILNGMSAFVTFIRREKTDVLLISNKAIFIEEGRQYVQVQAADGTIEKRWITAGLTNGSQSEITEGLAEGENVVTSGLVQ